MMTPSLEIKNNQLLEHYLEYCQYEKRLAQRSLAIYQNDLNQLVKFCEQQNCGFENITAQQIRSCLGQLRLQGYQASTLNLILSSWRGFFNWLTRYQGLAVNPSVGIKSLKQQHRLPKVISIEQATQLAETPVSDDTPFLELRDQAIVEMLYGSGLRVAELCSLDTHQHPKAISWIDMQQALVIVKGKGHKERIVPMGSICQKALEKWLAHRTQIQPIDPFALFIGNRGSRLTPQSIWQRLKRRAEKSDMSQAIHPHMLRHSFASHILQSSRDIRAVQELLGHSNISTTQIYTQLDFQHLATIYDASHPRAKK